MSTFAYAINTLKMGGGVTHLASTPEIATVVELDDATFKRLQGLNAVRKATEEEVEMAQYRESVANGSTVAAKKVAAPKAAKVAAPKPADTTKPASGADGDPQGKPAGSTVEGASDPDLNEI